MTFRLNPVSLPAGEQKQFEVEFALPGPMPLELSRLYMDGFDGPSPLGSRTTSSLDVMLRDGPEDATYELVGHTEMPVVFDRPTPQLFSSSTNGAYRHLSLEPLPRAGLKLHDRDLAYTFTRFPGRIWRITRIQDLNGNLVRLERDPEGLLLKIFHPTGLALEFRSDGRGLRTGYDLVGLDGSRAGLLSYAYDDAGRLVQVRHAHGESWSYEYDADGRRVRAVSDAGTVSIHRYDEAGRVVEVNPDQPYKSGRIEYLSESRVTVRHGGSDEAETLVFDEAGRNVATVQADGGMEKREFNELNDEIATTDANGNTTRFEHDAHGNMQSITNPAGGETFTVFDEIGRPLSVTEPDGATTEYEYDDSGNLITIVSPLGHRTDINVDAFGRTVGVMRHDGYIERREYDAHHRLTGVTDFAGTTTRYTYDAFCRPVRITEPGDRVTALEYAADAAGPFAVPTRVVRPDGVAISRSFTPRGDVASTTDGEGRVTRYRYGPYGILEGITDPRGHKLAFAYDSRERLTRVTNQLGLHWTFERDACGRIVRETDFDDRTLRFQYDPGGRVVRRDAPDGSRLEYEYDPANRMVAMSAFEPGDDEPEVTEYGYDENGRMRSAQGYGETVSYERDEMGRIIAEIADGRRIDSAIDCCGNRTRRALGDRVVDIMHDGMGRVRRWTLEGHTPLEFERDDLGLEIARRSAAGFVQLQEWDRVGQLTRQWAGLNAGADPDRASGEGATGRRYEWSRAFEPVAIDDALWGRKTYDYDTNGQIVRATHGDGAVERFSYGADLNIDGAGNAARFMQWQTSRSGVVHLARGPDGEAIELEHDVCGRVTRRTVRRDGYRVRSWTFRWDALDRMVGCTTPEGETWAYTYDPFGRRVSKACGVRSTRFVWDGDVLALEIADGVEREWFHEPGTFRPLGRRFGSAFTPIVCDHLGTPKEMLREDGTLLWAADHEVWGKLRKVAGTRGPAMNGNAALASVTEDHTCPIRFQGQWSDEETGLHYNRFRYYEPGAGQYLSRDPIGLVGGMNPWRYAQQPSTSVDPLGLEALNATGYNLYHILDSSGNVSYVGITNNPGVRETQHLASGRLGPGYNFEVQQRDLTYAQARGYEQADIEHYGTRDTSRRGEPFGPGESNRCNSYDPARCDKRAEAFEEHRRERERANCCRSP